MRRLHNRNLVDPISVGQTRPDRSDPSAAGSSLIENKYRRRRPRFDRLSSHKTNIFQENQQKKRKRRVSRRLCAVFLFFSETSFFGCCCLSGCCCCCLSRPEGAGASGRFRKIWRASENRKKKLGEIENSSHDSNERTALMWRRRPIQFRMQHIITNATLL